jgi:short-subunit dehydrogenase
VRGSRRESIVQESVQPFAKAKSSMILILGGSQGLGAQIASIYREQGQEVLTVGRTGDLKHDLSDLVSTKRLTTKIAEFAKFNRAITHFFWVAGVLTREPLETLTPEKILQMIDVNFRNSSLIAAAVWKEMVASGGRFVVISSTTGISETPSPLEAIYAATKAAQVSMTRALGKPNKSDRLKVSLFCPGGMKTGMWDDNEIEQALYDSFLDPVAVGAAIVKDVEAQKTPYFEKIIPRGSL